MVWDEAHQQFYKVFAASESRQLQVLPGRINASGKLSAILVISEFRKDGESSRQFVSPVGALLGSGLVTEDGLGLTQECEDLFDEFLMHLRNSAYAAEFYVTKSGRTVVAFKKRGQLASSRPLLMLPWWNTERVWQATKTIADS